MKLTEQERNEIENELTDFKNGLKNKAVTINCIQSILSRPEHGWEEEVEVAVNEIILLSKCEIPYYAYGDNEAACDMAQRLNEIGSIAGHAQLRTAQLRSELDEAKREIERLKSDLKLMSIR